MRSLLDTGFSGDDGAADPRLSSALAALRGPDEPVGPAGPQASGGPDDAAGPADPHASRGTAVPRGGSAAESSARRAAVLAALTTSRLLVPVVAVLGETEPAAGGLVGDKSADMAAVLLRGRDGRLALLAFSGLGALQRWRPDARPVPVDAVTAARAAVQQNASAVVVDVAGPVSFVVQGGDLTALARGMRPVRIGDGHGWVAQEAGAPLAREG